MTTHNRRN